MNMGKSFLKAWREMRLNPPCGAVQCRYVQKNLVPGKKTITDVRLHPGDIRLSSSFILFMEVFNLIRI